MKIITKAEHLSLQTKVAEVAIEMILKHSSVKAEVQRLKNDNHLKVILLDQMRVKAKSKHLMKAFV